MKPPIRAILPPNRVHEVTNQVEDTPILWGVWFSREGERLFRVVSDVDTKEEAIKVILETYLDQDADHDYKFRTITVRRVC